jgi:hypothetical protein
MPASVKSRDGSTQTGRQGQPEIAAAKIEQVCHLSAGEMVIQTSVPSRWLLPANYPEPGFFTWGIVMQERLAENSRMHLTTSIQ